MQYPEPATPAELKAFVLDKMGLTVPDRPVCSGHGSPWAYLAGGFFSPRDYLVWANRGGGKSMMASLLTCIQSIFEPRSDTILLGGSLDQSERVGDYVQELLGPLGAVDRKGTSRRRIQLTNGSSILVLPQSETAIRGAHVQRIRCDEVELFSPGVWRAVNFCTTGRGAGPGTLDVLSTAHVSGGLMEQLVASARRVDESGMPVGPPSEPERRSVGFGLVKWCLWEVIEKCPPQRRCDECLLTEDCRGLAKNSDGFFRIDDAIAIKARSSRAAWEAEILCRGARREHLVFGEFDPDVHVGPVAFCPDWPTYRAIDFGYAEPLVCLWIQVTPAGVVHVIDEYVQARRPLAHHAVEIIRRDPAGVKVVATYVDPAGRAHEAASGAACTELLAAAGVSCCWQTSTIAEGLELIRAALSPAAGEPALIVSTRCQRLIRAFQTYHYPHPGSSRAPDVPVKDGPDHCTDALRYFFINRMRPRVPVRRLVY